MVRKYVLILLSILLLGFTIRAYKINQLPLYGDELTMVYDSYSLLKTGKDQTGASFPLTFQMGAGRPAGYVYFSIPFVAIFGPGAWGVRGLSVLSSLGIILMMFLLVKKLFGEKVGLISAFLVSVSPWDLSLARGGFESHFALFLALSGLYFLLKVKKSGWNFILAVIFWGLTVNTYPTYKIVLPILLPIIIWYVGGVKNFLPKNKLVIFLGSILAIGIIGITLSQTFTAGSENRFLDLNLFSSSKEAVEQDINFNRSVDKSNSLIGKLFYNKPLSYFKLLGSSYLSDFSLEYLVVNGDKNPRHNMTSSGLIYVIEIVTIILGFGYFYNQKEKRRDFIFVLFWLLIAPIGATFMLDNHGLRTNFMLPPLIIFSALGIYRLMLTKRPILIIGVITIWLIQFIFVLERLYFLSPNRFARFWSNMAKTVATQSFEQKDNYNYIIISSKIDNVEYAYQVYNKIDPNMVIKQNSQKTTLGNYEFKKYDNVYIGSVPEGALFAFLGSLKGKAKYYGSFNEANLLGKYSTLLDLDNVPSAVIYEK